MDRRVFITTSAATVAAGLAGCLSTITNNNENNNGNNNNPNLPDTPQKDSPPHEPERPEDPGSSEDIEWDEHYLGDGMAETPTVDFERIVGAQLFEPVVKVNPDYTSAYAVTLVTSYEELDDTVDIDVQTGDSDDELSTVDFSEQAVIVIESGYGSSAVRHAWQRVEEVTDGSLHVNGYYVNPYMQTGDWTNRHSVLVVDKPADEIEDIVVSLTISEDVRMNISPDDGLVQFTD